MILQKSILRNISESDAFLLIISEYTFDPERINRDDDWIRREIREALRLNKPIILASIENQPLPNNLPDDIKDLNRKESIPFYARFYTSGVKDLANFITRATPIKRRANIKSLWFTPENIMVGTIISIIVLLALVIENGNQAAIQARMLCLTATKNDIVRDISNCTQTINFYPDGPVYFQRCSLYGHAHLWNNALTDCSQAIKYNPTDSNNYAERCWVNMNTRNWNSAITDCTQAINLTPSNATAYLDRAYSYCNKGDKEKAAEDYNQAMSLDSGDIRNHAKTNLAIMESSGGCGT